ncbi:MAG: prephenate dehydrogenase/arogenate dehydrogenase family protein [Candidatus Desulfofervidaceae bacterium]|nr:prephenate dehydrogenase/arogenate dehydrogenase family protein [Candidatus Desulfofervidaceae bacterium]
MKKPETIGIVGGTGRMGQWFKAFFEKKGYNVLISSRRTSLTAQDLARQADVVIVSVPISVTIDTIKEIGPYVRKEALLMDFTSLKQKPVEAMLEYSKAEVIGAHPLFGPGVNGLKGQVIVLCPARGEEWLPWVKDIFAEAHLEMTTPEEHDTIMAIVQALTHFLFITFGATAADLSLLPETLLRYSTPNFRALWERITNLTTQNPEIYASIQFDNPFYQEKVLPMFLKHLENLKQIILNRDAEAFMEMFKKIESCCKI